MKQTPKTHIINITPDDAKLKESERKVIHYEEMSGRQYRDFERSRKKQGRKGRILNRKSEAIQDDLDLIDKAIEEARESGDTKQVKKLRIDYEAFIDEQDKLEDEIEDFNEAFEESTLKNLLPFVKDVDNFPEVKNWSKLNQSEKIEFFDVFVPGMYNSNARQRLYLDIMGGLEEEEKKSSEATSNESTSNESVNQPSPESTKTKTD